MYIIHRAVEGAAVSGVAGWEGSHRMLIEHREVR